MKESCAQDSPCGNAQLTEYERVNQRPIIENYFKWTLWPSSLAGPSGCGGIERPSLDRTGEECGRDDLYKVAHAWSRWKEVLWRLCKHATEKKRENKIRNKDQSFACKHQMKNPVWKKILFEMHETSATEYFVSYNYLIRAWIQNKNYRKNWKTGDWDESVRLVSKTQTADHFKKNQLGPLRKTKT